jgi:predicted SnoaL-like aldol condensation-catalyzing enzyme
MNKHIIRRALAAGIAAASFSLATPGFARDEAKESANVKLVEDFYAALEQASAAGKMREAAPLIAAKFIAPNYIQHMEGVPGGRDGFITFLSQMPPGPPLPPPKILAMMSAGDQVIQVTSREMPDPVTHAMKPILVWNMFRIENGQLAEHWDAMPGFNPPPGAMMPPGGKPPAGMMMPPGGMPPGPPPAKP